jgi:hypothetical protein
MAKTTTTAAPDAPGINRPPRRVCIVGASWKIREAPAIVGCRTSSAVAHPGAVPAQAISIASQS